MSEVRRADTKVSLTAESSSTKIQGLYSNTENSGMLSRARTDYHGVWMLDIMPSDLGQLPFCDFSKAQL